MNSLRFINMSVKYAKGFVALYDINFDLSKGQTIAVTGPIGAGKASLLKAVAGLESYSGQILLDDRDMCEIPVRQRNFTFASHDSPLFYKKSIFDNIAYGLKIRGHAEAEIQARVACIADIFGITELLDKHPKHISNYQKSLTIASRAFVRDSDIYLLNDLDFGLNDDQAYELNSIIKKQLSGKTALISSLDFSKACYLADRIILLNRGEIQMQGKREDFLITPANEFCKLFAKY